RLRARASRSRCQLGASRPSDNRCRPTSCTDNSARTLRSPPSAMATLALFPHAEHGMTEYEVAPDGERVSTRYAPDYFAMMRDFARNGQLSGSYGSSVVVEPKKDPRLSVGR